MPNFLDNLTEYNAKASLAISQAVADGNLPKANMMSSLKSTANDTTLTEEIRLNALTALINLGSLLTIPLPPYFPVVTTFPDTQVYVGLHNELSGLQGGQAGEFYHLTQAQWTALGSAASAADISFENLQGFYTDNASLVGGFNSKQDALSGTGFVKINGTTISYDNSVYLTSSTGIASAAAFGGEVSGTYSNLTLINNAVIGKVLTGWNGSAAYSAITPSDTILSGMEKLNARISNIISNPAGVSSIAVGTNATSVLDVSPTTPPGTGAVNVAVNLQSQTQNKFLASPNGNTGVPSFRAIAVEDFPTVPGLVQQQYGSSTLIPQVTVDTKGRITAITTIASASGGQVNSVTFSGPGGVFLDSNTGTATDPIVGFTLDDVSANYVWAGPSSGPVGQPAFRALVLDDIAGITIPQSQIENLTETLSTFLTGSLANSTMYIGNVSNAAVNATATGDLSLTYVDNNGTNEAQFTINNGVVSYAKIQSVTAQTLLGRYSLTNGTIQELTLDPSDFTINNTTGVIGLVTPNPPTLTTKGDLLTSNGTSQVRLGIGANATIFMADTAASTGNKWVAMSGDVSIATSGATTIANNAVTFAKMQTIADGRILGNDSGGTAVPSELTGTQVTALLDIFSTTVKGLVPAATNTAYFLRGDGTWQPGTGGATTFPLTMNNSGSGAASGTTFDGSAARTISYNTIGAPSVTGTNASGTWPISITGNAGNVSGTVAIVNGGTGANTQQGAINNLVGAQSSGQYLRSNGTNVSMSSLAAADLTGSVAVANGGTGQTTYTDGQLLIGNSAGTLTKSTLTPGTGITITNGNGSITIGLVGGGSSVTTFSGGTTGLTPNTPTSGPVVLAGTLNVANGGTGLTSGNSGGILYYSASGTLASTATLGQYELIIGGGAGNPPVSLNNGATGSILTSNSTSSSPSWTAATYPSTTTANRILFSSANNVVDQITAPITANTFLKWDGTTFTWDTAGSGSGTVSSATAGQLAVYTGPTTVGGLTSTSGVIYTDPSAVAQSLSYAASPDLYLKVNSFGTGLIWDTAGSGSGTVGNGSQYQLAYYNGAGTTTSVIGLTSITASRALASDANGLPVASATTATELGYVSGVTSSIQTQLNAKAVYPTGAAGLAYYNGSSAWGTSYTTTGTGTVVALQDTPSIFSPVIGNTASNGHMHLRRAGALPAGYGNNYATLGFLNSTKTLSIRFDLDGFESEFLFQAATATKTYTFPNLSGTVALLANPASFSSLTSTSSVTIGTASTTPGTIVLQNASSSATQTIRGTNPLVGVTPTSIIYDLPTTAPTAGQVLSASAPVGSPGVVTLSWASGAGNVTSVATGSPSGNFAIFNDNTGTVINTPTGASLVSGVATFNNGVNIGVASASTGTLVFRNNTTAFTTTIQASTSASSDAVYYWPVSQATGAGQILANDGSGNLSWTAAGAGNMILASTQTNTGAKTFNSGTLILAGSTSGTTTLNASATAAGTVTLPALTGTVALLENAQIFTGAKTFNTGALTVNSAATFSGAAVFNRDPSVGTTVSISPTTGSVTNAQLTIGGGTIRWINCGGNFFATPTQGSRSSGTKIVLSPLVTFGNTECALGTSGTAGTAEVLWLSAQSLISFYPQNTTATVANMTSAGIQLPLAFDAANATINISGNGYQTWGNAVNNTGGPSLASRSNTTRIVLAPTFTVSTLYDTAIGAYNGSTVNATVGMWLSSPSNIDFWFSNNAANTIRLSSSGITIAGGANIILSTTTGTKIGTATNQLLGFFNATPVAQQTGGALTAAATYGTNEQTMLNRAYTALRNLGLIS